MPSSSLQILTLSEFQTYLNESRFARQIRVIQNHHTWKPNYTHLKQERDSKYWLESMRRTHMVDRKWSDIGQNLTTFPDGTIALCRPIDKSPAGIYGANAGAICIEHFGNFDRGGDDMTQDHQEAIIEINALLCKRFNIPVKKWSIVYHHWYSPTGTKFNEAAINNGSTVGKQKSCPGTNFFGGNTIASAEQNFFPRIQEKLNTL